MSLAAARAFLLDEYVGLPPGHPQSYRAFVAEHLESGVDLAPGAVQAPDAAAADPPAAGAVRSPSAAAAAPPAAGRPCEEAIAAAGGVDLQLLGIGGDGHIGFNE